MSDEKPPFHSRPARDSEILNAAIRKLTPLRDATGPADWRQGGPGIFGHFLLTGEDQVANIGDPIAAELIVALRHALDPMIDLLEHARTVALADESRHTGKATFGTHRADDDTLAIAMRTLGWPTTTNVVAIQQEEGEPFLLRATTLPLNRIEFTEPPFRPAEHAPAPICEAKWASRAGDHTVFRPEPETFSTFRLLREHATSPILLTPDTTDPDRFLAETIIARVRTTYELHGEYWDDDAIITGRTEHRAGSSTHYHGGGITGGDKISTSYALRKR